MNEILRGAREYWDSKLGARLMPARRDFDPILEVPKLLPWIVLTDVLRDPLDFRYRLIGTEVVLRSRSNYTGKRFTELAHTAPPSQVWNDRVRVIESRAPVLAEPPYTGAVAEISRVCGIHLPLSDDGVAVNMIMTVVDYPH